MSRRRITHLPNRWRITGWIVLSVLAVTFVVGVFSVAQVRSRFTQQIDSELHSQVATLRAALEVIGPEDLVRLTDEIPEGLSASSYGTTVILGDGQVSALPSGPSDDPDPPIDTSPRAVSALRGRAGDPFDLLSADGTTTYRSVVGQLPDGGLIVVTRPLADRDDAVRTVVGVLVLAGAVAAVLISVTVAVVSSLVTAPLDAMIDAAEDVGEGNLTSRLPTTGVDDVARLAAALNQMLDRLEQAFADRQSSEDALRRFVADASHELRTPLAAVLGYAELHQSGMTPPDQIDSSVERIRAEAERMRLIVDELLTLARLDEGRPMERAPVDLTELARLAVADARVIEPHRPFQLDAAGPVTVPGDVMSLRQALDNLVANARNHTPPDTAVRVSVRADGDAATVEVSDEGPGLSAEAASHVFERFYRADPSRHRSKSGPGGSGLGLAIVAAIAEAHGGKATVRSAPGTGATFALHLPTGGDGRFGGISANVVDRGDPVR